MDADAYYCGSCKHGKPYTAGCSICEDEAKNSHPLILCSSCPECGAIKTVLELDDDLGDGYRFCAECCQEWWTTIKYDNHIDMTQR